MDMEHQLQQLLHFSPPHEHLMASPPGFFAVDGGGHPAHFPNGGGFLDPALVDDDDGGWVEDLMQLGDELFGAEAGYGDGASAAAAAAAAAMDDPQPWLFDDGDSPEAPPPTSISLEGDGEQQGAGELASEPHHEDGDDASAATRKRRDRSKTIVSERKRRVRMKEKLYELRSLVPNITKMDKASIIADAVEYVKNLQARARKLKEEVSALEALPRSPSRTEPERRQKQQHGRRGGGAAGRRQQKQQQQRGAGSGSGSGSGSRVTHVGAAQVGEGRFFVTVECERRDGVAAPLCAAAESLACFRVESSSIGRAGPDRVVSTLTLKVSEQVGDAAAIGEGSVKLWMMAALFKEGFRPQATAEMS